MAKSKSGGSRSFLRGKLGADVYSIGKDGKGKKQQVVRALAETVANPQTQAQMRGRMIMSTVMQAQSALSQLIDHSFDGFPAGQPSISEFIRVNYGLIKADVAAHPSSSNNFGLAKYGEKGIKGGKYQIANGKAANIVGVAYDPANTVFSLGTYTGTPTLQDVANKLALADKEYITLVAIKNNGTASFIRLRIDPNADLTKSLTAENLAGLFTYEGTEAPTYAVTTGEVTVAMTGTLLSGGIIISRFNADGYYHNKAIMSGASSPNYTADVALPTYPVGNAKFLNGGDIAGLVDGGGTVTDDGPDNQPDDGD